MMESGDTGDGMDTEEPPLPMAIIMLENTALINAMAVDGTNGMMGVSTMGCSERINVTVRVGSNGPMGLSMTANSATVNAKGRAFTAFRTAAATKALGRMGGTVDLVFVRGKMGVATRASGSMAWRMERAWKPLLMARSDTMVSGSRMNLSQTVS